MPPVDSFRYEVEKSPDVDQHGNKVTTIKCHGRLISEHSNEIKDLVKPLIPLGGPIVMRLAALFGFKVTTVKQGLVRLEFANMTPRVLELLRISNLLQTFSS